MLTTLTLRSLRVRDQYMGSLIQVAYGEGMMDEQVIDDLMTLRGRASYQTPEQ